MNGLAKLLVATGIALVVLGGLLLIGSRLGIGRLPGDIVIRRGNFTFFFPLATSILLSLLLTLLLWLFSRIR